MIIVIREKIRIKQRLLFRKQPVANNDTIRKNYTLFNAECR